MGGLPRGMHECAHRSAREGKLLVMTTQVQNEGSDLAVYGTGRPLSEDPLILEAYDMTTEAAVTKLDVAAPSGCIPGRGRAALLHAGEQGHTDVPADGQGGNMSILERLPENEIISAVLEAGKLLDGAGAVHEVHAKNRTDFVTDVDLRVQETLKTWLAELLPEVQFMGEEQDNSAIDCDTAALDTGPCGRHDKPDSSSASQRHIPRPGRGWARGFRRRV